MIYMAFVPANANGCANYEWGLLNIVGRKVVPRLVPKPISRSILKMVQENELRNIIIDKVQSHTIARYCINYGPDPSNAVAVER